MSLDDTAALEIIAVTVTHAPTPDAAIADLLQELGTKDRECLVGAPHYKTEA